MKIVLSFFGANENLQVLEGEYLKKDIITFPQYTNFLSQVALCIELGMKSILLNEDNVLKTHDLKELYNKMPKSFHDMFENNPFPKKTIEKSLNEIKKIFEDFRYMNTEHLGFFTDKIIFTTDYKVIFSQVRRLQNFQFIIYLFDKIKEFYNYLSGCIDKENIFKNTGKKQFTFTIKNTALLSAINQYNEELKKTQPQLTYGRKD
jgi:flagellin-specific chaperone FliS